MRFKVAVAFIISLYLLGSICPIRASAAEVEKTRSELHTVPIAASINGEKITSAALSGSGLLALGTAAGHLSIVDRNFRPWHGGWERSSGSSPILGLAFSQDEAAIAARTGDMLAVWSLDGEAIGKIPLTAEPSAMALSPGGRLIALAGFDVSVYELSTHRLLRTLQQDVDGGAGVYEDVAFSADGATLAAASLDHIDAWNIESGKQVQHWRCKCAVDGVSFSRDATMAVVGTAAAHALLWELASAKVLKDKAMPTEPGDHVYGTAVSLKGNLADAGTAGGFVVIWDTGSGAIVARTQPSQQPIVLIASSLDGQVLLVEGQKKHFVRGSYDRWLITLTQR